RSDAIAVAVRWAWAQNSLQIVSICSPPKAHGAAKVGNHSSMKNTRLSPRPHPNALALAAALLAAAAAGPAGAQNYPITSQQRAIAQQTAQQGVPLSELAPNAPDEYTVRRGDTLWAISRMYLRSPWRWPELWGMNLSDIANPHRIYPGQVLYLDKTGGRARLSTRRGGSGGTVKLSPRTRYESASDLSLPTLNPSLIEP